MDVFPLEAGPAPVSLVPFAADVLDLEESVALVAIPLAPLLRSLAPDGCFAAADVPVFFAGDAADVAGVAFAAFVDRGLAVVAVAPPAAFVVFFAVSAAFAPRGTGAFVSAAFAPRPLLFVSAVLSAARPFFAAVDAAGSGFAIVTVRAAFFDDCADVPEPFAVVVRLDAAPSLADAGLFALPPVAAVSFAVVPVRDAAPLSAARPVAPFVVLVAVLAPVRVVPVAPFDDDPFVAVAGAPVPAALVPFFGACVADLPVADGALVLPLAEGVLERDVFALVPIDAFFAATGFASAAVDFFAAVVPAAFEVFDDVAMVLSRIVKRNR